MMLRLKLNAVALPNGEVMINDCCMNPVLETESIKSGRFKGAATTLKIYCTNCRTIAMSLKYR